MVAQPWPGIETAPPAAERGPAPAVSEVAELRSGVEAASLAAERWPASESSVAEDELRPDGEAAPSTAERRLRPRLR